MARPGKHSTASSGRTCDCGRANGACGGAGPLHRPTVRRSRRFAHPVVVWVRYLAGYGKRQTLNRFRALLFLQFCKNEGALLF